MDAETSTQMEIVIESDSKDYESGCVDGPGCLHGRGRSDATGYGDDIHLAKNYPYAECNDGQDQSIFTSADGSGGEMESITNPFR